MKLVDRGVVDLDTPLVTYLPAFRMAAAGYEKITVRMLLNHSSGVPGTDYRNAIIDSPVPGYLDQALQTLSMSRLKAPPGYMSVYCNDGFTITEALIEAMSGKSYVQFVQDEILTPLGMANTRYPLSAFPAGSYAKSYIIDQVGNLGGEPDVLSIAEFMGRIDNSTLPITCLRIRKSSL